MAFYSFILEVTTIKKQDKDNPRKNKRGNRMRKLLIFGAILFCLRAKAEAIGQPVQEQGAVVSTCVAIQVSSTPALMLSTGTNNPCVGGMLFSGFPSTATTSGQFLCGRTYLEIRNDSTESSVWIGPNSNVSSAPTSVNYGIQIPTVSARIDFDSYPNWWIVSNVKTSTNVVIIQKGNAFPTK